MRIAISGTAGVGKTTLVNLISEKYKLPISNECAKELLESEEYTWRDIQLYVEKFVDFQWELLQNKIALESGISSFISDRTYLDFIIYVENRMARIPSVQLYEPIEGSKHFDGYTFLDFYNEYKDMCIKESQKGKYDVVFFIEPFTDMIANDGLRNVNPIYNKMVSKSIRYELEHSELKDRLCILTGNILSDKIRVIDEIIKGLN